MYQTLEKVGFSSNNYKELLDLYNEKIKEYLRNDTDLLNIIPKEAERKILREVACLWLNKEDESSITYNIVNKSSIKAEKATNYDRWNILGEEKQELNIAGIFPMSGNIYKARELVPGEYL